jgi:hypothetical protein
MRARTMQGLTLGLAMGIAMAGASQDASSQSRRDRGEGGVTAENRYGLGRVTAPTRQGPYGREVRLPSGTWIDCKGSCTETLRDETVDFWKKREELLPRGR